MTIRPLTGCDCQLCFEGRANPKPQPGPKLKAFDLDRWYVRYLTEDQALWLIDFNHRYPITLIGEGAGKLAFRIADRQLVLKVAYTERGRGNYAGWELGLQHEMHVWRNRRQWNTPDVRIAPQRMVGPHIAVQWLVDPKDKGAPEQPIRYMDGPQRGRSPRNGRLYQFDYEGLGDSM